MGHSAPPKRRKPYTTMAEAWTEFARIVCVDMDGGQLEFARMCFFSGAVALEGAMNRLSAEGLARGQVEEAVEKVDALLKEVDAFRLQVHMQSALQRVVEEATQQTKGTA